MSKAEMLSEKERSQLGKPRPGSSFLYTDEAEWLKLREILVEKSMEANPHLKDRTMIAYTPGETYTLLQHPEVTTWHDAVDNFEVPSEYETIILVPCAKTKPWDERSSRKSELYRAYHEVLRRTKNSRHLPKVYFATISEPLGIVPQEMWDDFPQYDNPGLFKEDYLRTGFFNKDWDAKIGNKRILPFDDTMYRKCINKLGGVVAAFIRNNHKGRRILGFVDSLTKDKTTHQDMLDVALELLRSEGVSDVNLERYPKRRVPRESPLGHILEKL